MNDGMGSEIARRREQAEREQNDRRLFYAVTLREILALPETLDCPECER